MSTEPSRPRDGPARTIVDAGRVSDGTAGTIAGASRPSDGTATMEPEAHDAERHRDDEAGTNR